MNQGAPIMSQDLATKYQGKFLEAKNLPALPAVLQEAMSNMNTPGSNMRKVADIFAKDQVLCAKVLRMVNSPIYGFSGRIVSIHNALVLLGFNVVRGLIISTVVFDNLPPAMRELGEHSLACSRACKEIAVALKFKGVEEFSLAGLLHDLGKIILAIQLPQAHNEIVQSIAEKDILCVEAEKHILGFTHAQINYWVAGHWNLPANLKTAMSMHHTLAGLTDHKPMACVVHLADFLTRLFERGSGGDDNVSTLDPLALKLLDLGQRDLGDLVDRVGEAFNSKSSGIR